MQKLYVNKCLSSLFIGMAAFFISTGTYAISKEEGAAVSYGIKHTISSEVLSGERTLQIYLPKDYDSEIKKYPVIYTMDGDFLFQPAVTISSIRSSRGLMPQSIVVSISNPTNAQRFSMGMPMKRTLDADPFLSQGQPDKFLDFLEDELMPYIENTYRTANHKTLVGMSPTAGPVMVGYLKRPKLFDAYVAFASDPNHYTLDDKLIADQLVESAHDPARESGWLYMSRGGLDVYSNPKLLAPFFILKAGFAKLSNGHKAMAEIVDGGEHYEMSISGFTNAFRFIYPENIWRQDYIDIRVSDTPAKDLQEFYTNLSEQYGFQAYPVIDGYWMGRTIAGLARYFVRREKFDQATESLLWAKQFYQNNIDIEHGLSSAYQAKGNMDLATKHAKEAHALAEKQKDTSVEFYNKRYEELKLKSTS